MRFNRLEGFLGLDGFGDIAVRSRKLVLACRLLFTTRRGQSSRPALGRRTAYTPVWRESAPGG